MCAEILPHRRPVKKCAAHRVLCPNPLCNQQHHGKHRGIGVSRCEHCDTEFFYHSANGGAEIVGLWPGEADAIDIDAPLPRIWELLGLMAVA